MEGNSEHTRIRGIVLPVDWDAKGNAIKAAIFTANEEEYLIEENDKSKQLLNLMQQEVDVKGIVREESGQKTVMIVGYRKVKKGLNLSLESGAP